MVSFGTLDAGFRGEHGHARPLFVRGFAVSNMKIIPIIADAERQAEQKAAADLHELIDAIDIEIDELQQQLDQKIEQIEQRLSKLEEGV